MRLTSCHVNNFSADPFIAFFGVTVLDLKSKQYVHLSNKS